MSKKTFFINLRRDQGPAIMASIQVCLFMFSKPRGHDSWMFFEFKRFIYTT